MKIGCPIKVMDVHQPYLDLKYVLQHAQKFAMLRTGRGACVAGWVEQAHPLALT